MQHQTRELVVVLIHLALWSMLGVLTRIYLDILFSTCKSGRDFGVCLTSEGIKHNTLGAYFTDLPSNMLGSFVMGLLAAGASIGLRTKKEIAILPVDSGWQSSPELHIGLRTGFCGSLTTFASWEYSLVSSLIGGAGKQGGQWAEFLWGLVIGLQMSLSSYVFGVQCALIVDRFITPQGRSETELQEMAAESVATSQELKETNGAGLTDAEIALQRDEFAEEEEVTNPFHLKTNVGAAVALALLVALFVALTILDNSPQHLNRRSRWLAILFGPFGCTLRWALSKTNYTLPGEWKWLPVGTLSANMLACVIDWLVGGSIARMGKLSYWSTIVTYCVRTGFCGALSTVSTYVAEINAQFKVLPDKLHGLYYAIGSLLLGALLGVIIYGSMVWAH